MLRRRPPPSRTVWAASAPGCSAHGGLSSCHRASRLPRRADASSRAPFPPKGRRCRATSRSSSAPPWPHSSPAAGCRVQGEGQRFLSLAGGQVGSQTCPALQLKGAALGVRSVLTAGAERPALSERGPSSFRAGRSGRGQEERPLGGEPSYLASTLRAGRLPGLRVGTDPPPSSAAAPLHLFYFLLLPWPPFSSDCCGR